MGYPINSVRMSVNSIISLGKTVKVIDDYNGRGVLPVKGPAIELPHVHAGCVDIVRAATPYAWQKAIEDTERERKMMGPCLCITPPITIDDVTCFREEWYELIADIKSGNIGNTSSIVPNTTELQYYSCSRALSDGRYSGLNRDITEKYGQWYVRVLKGAPYCTGDWCVFALQTDNQPTGEQSIIIRSTSAQAAAEKAETILTAISLCF